MLIGLHVQCSKTCHGALIGVKVPGNGVLAVKSVHVHTYSLEQSLWCLDKLFPISWLAYQCPLIACLFHIRRVYSASLGHRVIPSSSNKIYCIHDICSFLYLLSSQLKPHALGNQGGAGLTG
jgi:hypothetical protein